MADLRLFIALELPDDVRSAIKALQDRLRGLDRQHVVRWTGVDSIHLTLKFLGDTPADRVPDIETAIRAAAKDRTAFELAVEGIGFFPNAKRPRIVWTGVHGELAPLHALQAAVEEKVGPLDYPPEDREFSPHLTIGRLRDASPADLSAISDTLSAVKVDRLGSWHVDRICLMQSDLKPSGAIYTRLAEVKLN